MLHAEGLTITAYRGAWIVSHWRSAPCMFTSASSTGAAPGLAGQRKRSSTLE